ncbi:uncharacterized protein LOC111134890 [Crassostrea virginica]|uniref:Actin-depolymerizing factor 6-like n=1 Tax=Crassostrea virginica TaxID=6565 RepID=A0A8B8EKQ1_CRAVI|nr:actin-depolymerizing factor 6-like [Crassostrea virginica]|mmetsp:Transcript_3584/g.6874  ORF Transcript_3584/g.6874 Transcript_3584/m.6874 type:complete len:144 (-) Transcript_3584:1044-1475(-)|eukprot:CAMPEP_0203756084 /NCGR_PEP_ID=MMETSP0098-20131031/9415_1 /ASSEMBLY_ACC=CAM_ASM_000208 /TAXON_ID=96639 /ORGANISM=" , Strain NY0313808BC1" /LENGTH=143 /DNA_ID=CAMNT_0050647799 /DNA_START=34 /DNA_END=465 /DNA_ORIENTATION=-
MPGGGMSGVTVADDAVTAYQALQKNKEHSFIIFKIQDEKKIIVAEKGDKSQSWDELISRLPPDNGAYVVYDLSYKAKSGAENTKPILITWAPDTASIKVKMMYSSSKDSLKKKLGEGLGIEIQANDHSDLDLNEIRQKQESKY